MTMDMEVGTILYIVVAALLAWWRVKRGFKNGMCKEIVNILSGCISLACVVLIFYLISSIMTRAMSTLAVCIIALVILGLLFKICNLIFKPLLAIEKVSVIGELNKALGAVLGLAEALAIVYVLYRIQSAYTLI